MILPVSRIVKDPISGIHVRIGPGLCDLPAFQTLLGLLRPLLSDTPASNGFGQLEQREG